MPLQVGKIPIVVPRQRQFNEHVNDHQVEFARNVSRRMRTIIDVEDIETLGDVITNYKELSSEKRKGETSHNAVFCQNFEKMIEEVFAERITNDKKE